MSARYLLRFDDICPGMNWDVWSAIEPVLMEHGVLPIIAVVPDNKDPKLNVRTARPDFWQWVRERQALGWCIALHGYQHLYETKDPGLLDVKARSEFAGLSEEAQRGKLQRALEIFRANGVRADAWVAPGHSFDATTVRVLLELGINTISDGYYPKPVQLLNAYWIPQQLWHFRPMPPGVWTVCLHCNAYSEQDIAQLRASLARYADRMISVPEISRLYPARPPGLLDLCMAAVVPRLQAIRRRLKRR